MPDQTNEKAGAPTPPTRIDTNFEAKADAAKADDPKVNPRQGLPDTVQVQEANTPFVPDTTQHTAANGQYIQYNGVGTVRIMGPAEWKAAGVDSNDYFEWNYLNHKRIPRSAFTDEQLQYLLRIDDRFELVEVAPEPEAKQDN